jgi:asparagine synthetase B (glutamine-hydrolysing)
VGTRYLGYYRSASFSVREIASGIKPFYYITQGSNLYFASEYKALKQLPDFDSSAQ